MKLSTKLEILNEKFGTDFSIRDVIEKMGTPTTDYNVKCFYDCNKKELFIAEDFGGTRYEEDEIVLLYEYKKNFWAEGFDVGDFVSETEWDEMIKRYGDDAHCDSSDQINEMYGNFLERFIDYIEFSDDDVDESKIEVADFEKEISEIKEKVN